MPARSTRLAVGAFVAAVAWVGGCSIGGREAADGLAPADEIEVAQSQPPPAGQAVRISAGGPPVELPSGFTLTFDEHAAVDPAERAILDDTAMLVAAMYQAIGRGDPDDPLYRRYASGAARAGLRDVIAVFATNDWTVTGSADVYNRAVNVTANGVAAVSWCADLHAVFPMEITSGHVLESAAGDHSYLYYRGTVERDSGGVWVATQLRSDRSAPECLSG